MRLLDRHHQHCPKRRYRGTQPKDKRIDPLYGDAKGLCCFTVQLGCAQDQPQFAAGHQNPDAQTGNAGGGNHKQLVRCSRQTPREIEFKPGVGKFKPRNGEALIERWGHRVCVGPIGHQGNLLQHIKNTDCGNDGTLRIII